MSSQAAYEYGQFVRRSKQLVRDGCFEEAINVALLACDRAGRMMQHVTKKSPTRFRSVDSFDIVFELAPPVLHAKALDDAERILRSKKVIERDTSADMGELLEQARTDLHVCGLLWRVMWDGQARTKQELCQCIGFTSETVNHCLAGMIRLGVAKRLTREPTSTYVLLVSSARRIGVKCGQCGGHRTIEKFTINQASLCSACGCVGVGVWTEAVSKEL